MEGMHSYVGIDVSKANLDVYLSATSQSFTIKNSQEGHRQLCERLPQPGECSVIVEATGGYQRELVVYLVDMGHLVSVVNPKRVRDFARALGEIAKTDKIDARILARFGQTFQPRTIERTSEKQRELEALVRRRRQLVELRAVEKNHRQTVPSRSVYKNIQKVIDVLSREIRNIEQEIQKLVEAEEPSNATAQIIGSVPGAGAVLVTTLLTELPELGHANRKEIVALAGLAPYNRDSGKFAGKRKISGGRMVIRNVLYMAARAATRCNPPIQELYQRLLKAGKPNKVAIVACMRKLLTIIHHLVKTNSRWDPNHAT
jgi:transposase